MFLKRLYLITGVSSGIGLEIAHCLLLEGAQVIGLTRNPEDNLSKFPSASLTDIELLQCDLDDPASLEKVLNSSEFLDKNKLSGVVFSAGIENTTPLRLLKSNEVESLFRINVIASIEILRLTTKKSTALNGCSILFLSSVVGVTGASGKISYSASKAAITGLVKSAAIELARRRIRVNSIAPGVVETPMSKELMNRMTSSAQKELRTKHLLGVSSPSDIAHLILFLLSDNSTRITGQNLIIDGGYSLS